MPFLHFLITRAMQESNAVSQKKHQRYSLEQAEKIIHTILYSLYRVPRRLINLLKAPNRVVKNCMLYDM